MPWITSMKVAETKTVFGNSNAKAERELVISFAPGELQTTDSKAISMYARDMGTLVRAFIDEALMMTPEVTSRGPPPQRDAPPPQQSAPAEKTDAPADGEWDRKDKFGNVWPKEITCKMCGMILTVGKNRYGHPFALCEGPPGDVSRAHVLHFLNMDGSLGKEAKPREDK